MKTLTVKAVMIVDKYDNYIIHGTSTETPTEMFEAVSPLWHFDPSNEQIHYLELQVKLPDTKPDDDIQPS